jgi:hypothetical protein
VVWTLTTHHANSLDPAAFEAEPFRLIMPGAGISKLRVLARELTSVKVTSSRPRRRQAAKAASLGSLSSWASTWNASERSHSRLREAWHRVFHPWLNRESGHVRVANSRKPANLQPSL